jgi:hypothetical protein
MNVSGVGATPPQPPLPPVAPAAAATSPAPSDGRPGGEPAPREAKQPRAVLGHGAQPGQPGQVGEPRQPGQRAHDAAQRKSEASQAPPLRMLTVTEMRIMLGQLPVRAGLKPEHHDADPTAAA